MGLLFSKVFKDFPKEVSYYENEIDNKKYKTQISGFETRKYMKEVRKVFEKNKLDETLKTNKNGKKILKGDNLIRLLANPYVLVSKELLTTTKPVCLSIFKGTTITTNSKKSSIVKKKIGFVTDVEGTNVAYEGIKVAYPREILKLIKEKYKNKSNNTKISLTEDLGLKDEDIKNLGLVNEKKEIVKKEYTLSELRNELTELLPSTKLPKKSLENLGLNQSGSGFNLNYFMLQLDVKNPIEGEFNDKSILSPKLVKKLILKNKNLTKTCTEEDKNMYQLIINQLDKRINIFNIIQSIYNKFRIQITYEDYDAYGLLKISKLNEIIDKLMSPLNKTKYKLLNLNKNKKEEVDKNLNKLKKYLYYNKIIKCFYQIEKSYFNEIIDFINKKDKKLIYSVDLLILELQNKINDYFNDNPRNKKRNNLILSQMSNTNDKKKLKEQLDIIKKITNGERITPLTESDKPLRKKIGPNLFDIYRIDDSNKKYLFNLLTIWSELCCNNILMEKIFTIYREQLNKIETIDKFYSFNGKLNFNNVYIEEDYVYFYEKIDKKNILNTETNLINEYLNDYNRSLFGSTSDTFFYDHRNNKVKQFSYVKANELNEIFDYNKIEDISKKCSKNSTNENIDCDYYKTMGFLLQQANAVTINKFNFDFAQEISKNNYVSLNNRDYIIIEQDTYFILIILYSITVKNSITEETHFFNKTLQISFYNKKEYSIINYYRTFDFNKKIATINDFLKYLQKEKNKEKNKETLLLQKYANVLITFLLSDRYKNKAKEIKNEKLKAFRNYLCTRIKREIEIKEYNPNIISECIIKINNISANLNSKINFTKIVLDYTIDGQPITDETFFTDDILEELNGLDPKENLGNKISKNIKKLSINKTNIEKYIKQIQKSKSQENINKLLLPSEPNKQSIIKEIINEQLKIKITNPTILGLLKNKYRNAKNNYYTLQQIQTASRKTQMPLLEKPQLRANPKNLNKSSTAKRIFEQIKNKQNTDTITLSNSDIQILGLEKKNSYDVGDLKKLLNQTGGSKKLKSIRKHRGIYQSGPKANKLRPGFKYTGERTKTGLKVIAEIKK